jgi:hypothetical protein
VIALIAALVANAPPAGASGLVLPPNQAERSGSYVFDFASEYGGGPVNEHGTLRLRQRTPARIVISGENVRSGAGALRDTGPPQATTLRERVATRGSDGFIAAPGERSRVADLIFDYDSLVTLLPRRGSELATGTHWAATTKCWISHTDSTDIPVTVVVAERRGTTTTLRARGAKRVTLVIEGHRVTTDAAVSVDMTFSRNLFSRATMHATQTYARNGIPAGGGSYSWVVKRTG